MFFYFILHKSGVYIFKIQYCPVFVAKGGVGVGWDGGCMYATEVPKYSYIS
jgi:hypothetical protein